MYHAYLKEREGLETVSDDRGFATFLIIGRECYLKDIYVQPEARKSGVAASLADRVTKIAKDKGCNWLTGSVSPPAKGSHESLLVLLAYGMRLLKAEKDMIYMVKEI